MSSDKKSYFTADIVEEYKLAGNSFTAIGRCDTRLRTVSAWLRPLSEWENENYSSENYERGMVYYLQGDKLVGVLLWNMPDPAGTKENRAIHVINGRRLFVENEAITSVVINDEDVIGYKNPMQLSEEETVMA